MNWQNSQSVLRIWSGAQPRGMGSVDIDYEADKVDYDTRNKVMNKLTSF
ncbi:MAG: hypothetical protein IJF07_09015 [Lachnospiraceae bacterium]|nr:hypothetical protein [Lachnospiraceae bacterium]